MSSATEVWGLGLKGRNTKGDSAATAARAVREQHTKDLILDVHFQDRKTHTTPFHFSLRNGVRSSAKPYPP